MSDTIAFGCFCAAAAVRHHPDENVRAKLSGELEALVLRVLRLEQRAQIISEREDAALAEVEYPAAIEARIRQFTDGLDPRVDAA